VSRRPGGDDRRVKRRRALVGIAVVALALVVGVVVVVDGDDDGSDARSVPAAGTASARSLAAALASARPATKPFTGLTEVRLRFGADRCLELAVADSYAERIAGLRDTPDIGTYDGMIFVDEAEAAAAFTMSGVTVPLDIAFYRPDGSRDSSRAMKPCPKAQAECPVYRSDGRFLYAVETHHGQLPGGSLSPCTG
jgi:uncharacterized membrane protein (UPF0127 family)